MSLVAAVPDQPFRICLARDRNASRVAAGI